MVTYNHMMFSDQVDVKRIAGHWVRKTGYMLDKALDYRLKDGNASKFTDIWYDDMVRNSEQELSRIYSLDGGLTPDLIQRFIKHEKEHPHRKYGSHQYSLADFGLKEDDIDQFTTRYQEFISKHYGR